MVEVAGLAIVPVARVLYAATHGRSAWKLASAELHAVDKRLFNAIEYCPASFPLASHSLGEVFGNSQVSIINCT
jgi:hypothetical protein